MKFPHEIPKIPTLLFVFLAVFALLIPSQVKAAPTIIQGNTGAIGSTWDTAFGQIFNGISGKIVSVQWAGSLFENGADTSYKLQVISCFTDSAGTIPCPDNSAISGASQDAASVTMPTSPGVFFMTLPVSTFISTYNFNPAYYYDFAVSRTAFGDIMIPVGSATSVYPTSPHFSNSVTGVADIYFGYTASTPDNLSTRIEWVNPPITTPSATTSSSTVDFEFNYYLNSNDSDTDTFTHILLQLYPLSYPNDPPQRVVVETPLVPDSLENVVVTVTTNKLGYYLGMVSFWNGVEETTTCNWWDFFSDCTAESPIVGATFKNNFNIATTTIPADAPPFIVQGMDSICNGIDSSFFGIDTLMCKTLAFLFMPGEYTTQEIQMQMNNAFRTNLPFATFYAFDTQVKTAIDTEGESQGDVVLHLPGMTSEADLTVFSYSWARAGMENMFDIQVGNVIVWCEWIFFTILSLWMLTKPKES